MNELLQQFKKELNAALEHFNKEVAGIRTSRATPSLIEDIKVNAYGSVMTVKEIASISVPEPRVLYVQPWDKNLMKVLEDAIRSGDAGLNPIADGDALRIVIPPLSEERRKEFVKLLQQKMEAARIRIRQEREGIWKKAQQMEKAKELREDEKFKLKEKLQETVDEYNRKIDELGKKKEEELMT